MYVYLTVLLLLQLLMVVGVRHLMCCTCLPTVVCIVCVCVHMCACVGYKLLINFIEE